MKSELKRLNSPAKRTWWEHRKASWDEIENEAEFVLQKKIINPKLNQATVQQEKEQGKIKNISKIDKIYGGSESNQKEATGDNPDSQL